MPTLIEQYRHRLARRAGDGEVRSWERSLHVLSADLIQAGLDEVEVLVEYQLPLTSKRADVVLCGVHPKTGAASFVVVELKQWSAATVVAQAPDVVQVAGYGGERLHPAEQVRRYCTFLLDFLAALEPIPDVVSGVAYLHNARDRDVLSLWSLPEDGHGRLFTGQRRDDFLAFLRSRLAPGDGTAAAATLQGSAVRPSRQLLALAAAEVQQREQFVLLDQQQTAYSLVLRAVEAAHHGDAKEVLVVTGGPGSGKSVIALALLGELARQGRTVVHATGSSAFTSTLRRVAGRRAPRVRSLFQYFNSFVDAERNGFDVLLCDEAHRIRETSANRFTRAALRTGRAQVDELLDAARVPVFLLDEHQVVRPGEIGTVADIKAAAARKQLPVRHISLDEQFRCGGSRAYEEWVLRFLGLAPGGPVAWTGDEHFSVDVVGSPQEMEDVLRRCQEQGYQARIAAGYCWPWSDPPRDAPLVADVVIGDWRRPWNNKRDSAHLGAPGRPFWASEPAGFGQVGCVYTAQGFEYDWAGVILADDLVWRDGAWRAQPGKSHDTAVKRAPLPEFDRAVRNTYRVLLTRGMVGALVMSTDAETQRLLESLVRVRQPAVAG